MNHLCIALAIYVAFDVVATAYVVYKRGGIKATIAEVKQNLGWTRENEEEADNRW